MMFRRFEKMAIVSIISEQPSYVFSYFPFDFEGGIWNLIVSDPEHCLFFFTLFGGLTHAFDCLLTRLPGFPYIK